MGRSAAGAYLGVGVGLIGLHLAVGGSAAVYDSVSLAAAGVIFVAVAYYRPPNWLGWVGLGVGQLLFAAGDISSNLFPVDTFPSRTDVLYLSAYAFLIGGLIALMGRSFPWRDVTGNLEALLATFALGLSCWIDALDDTMTVGWSGAQVVSVAYPLLDLVCVGLLFRVALAPGRRPAAFWLMLGSFIPLFLADLTYVVPSLGDTYTLGSWLDIGWLGSYVLVGMAALLPSMSRLAATTGRTVPSAPLLRVIVGGAALLTLPISVLVETQFGQSVNVRGAAIGGTVLLVGALFRISLLVREIDVERQRAEHSERRFRMIFERAPIGISVGRNGVMSETNPALQSMLGYNGRELAGMHYTEVTHPDDRALPEQMELDAGKRDSYIADKQYVRKDGSIVDTRVRVVLDLDDGFGMSLLEDVTDQKRLEAQLLESQKLEAIGKLAGGIAHDFNNLMTAVIGYSDLLLRDPTDRPGPKIAEIREAATRASDLTKQLLAFGRRQTLKATRLDLREVICGMQTLLRTLAGDQIRVAICLSDDPVPLVADRAQLERVLMNLAVNACTAMPDGGTLTVSSYTEDGEAVLVVADDGVGMDADTELRIFEPYFSTKPPTEASGLGLATVHGIVGQSGGTIAVETSPGNGAVFTIRLPQGASLRPYPVAATLR